MLNIASMIAVSVTLILVTRSDSLKMSVSGMFLKSSLFPSCTSNDNPRILTTVDHCTISTAAKTACSILSIILYPLSESKR
jgi:hypothetical protein